MPLVSVVMPVHNSAATLLPSVRSVLAQTHPDLELLITDDGSSGLHRLPRQRRHVAPDEARETGRLRRNGRHASHVHLLLQDRRPVRGRGRRLRPERACGVGAGARGLQCDPGPGPHRRPDRHVRPQGGWDEADAGHAEEAGLRALVVDHAGWDSRAGPAGTLGGVPISAGWVALVEQALARPVQLEPLPPARTALGVPVGSGCGRGGHSVRKSHI